MGMLNGFPSFKFAQSLVWFVTSAVNLIRLMTLHLLLVLHTILMATLFASIKLLFLGVLQKLIRDVELNLDFCYRN